MSLSKKKLDAIAKDAMEHNKLKEAFVTEDGQVFASRYNAASHARGELDIIRYVDGEQAEVELESQEDQELLLTLQAKNEELNSKVTDLETLKGQLQEEVKEKQSRIEELENELDALKKSQGDTDQKTTSASKSTKKPASAEEGDK